MPLRVHHKYHTRTFIDPPVDVDQRYWSLCSMSHLYFFFFPPAAASAAAFSYKVRVVVEWW